MSLSSARLGSLGPSAPSPCSDGCLTPLQARGVSSPTLFSGTAARPVQAPRAAGPGDPV